MDFTANLKKKKTVKPRARFLVMQVTKRGFSRGTFLVLFLYRISFTKHLLQDCLVFLGKRKKACILLQSFLDQLQEEMSLFLEDWSDFY